MTKKTYCQTIVILVVFRQVQIGSKVPFNEKYIYIHVITKFYFLTKILGGLMKAATHSHIFRLNFGMEFCNEIFTNWNCNHYNIYSFRKYDYLNALSYLLLRKKGFASTDVFLSSKLLQVNQHHVLNKYKSPLLSFHFLSCRLTQAFSPLSVNF